MRSGPKAYRHPADPGFIGGYQWRSALFGCLLLLLGNWCATQYVAHQFEYQRALGVAWVRTPAWALYQPFSWAWWVLKHGSSENPAIRVAVLSGALIVVASAMVTIGIVYLLNMRRTKQLSADAEDLHGSARWASKQEIAESGLMQNPRGVYVGGWYDAEKKRLKYLRHDGAEHVLAFAPSRSGKGVGLVIPTLLACEDSVVVYDIKGENWAKTAGFRASMGQTCFKFMPTATPEEGSNRFNPLAEIRLGTARDVSDAENIALMLIFTGKSDNPAERYWQEAAQQLTTGMILHVCYEADAEGRVASLADVARVYMRPGESFRETLQAALACPHDPLGKYKWTMPNGARTITHPVVKERVQQMLNKEDKDFSGVLSNATTALAVYTDPLVARNICASDFRARDLVNHPVSLYLIVPPSDEERLRPLIRLMFTVIVNRLTERLDFQHGAEKPNRHRLLFLIDEFPSLQRMDIFAKALSYMAGYGLKAYLITQDVRQIINEYGPNESIVSNCQVRVAFAPNQQETAELLSKMTGTQTIQKATFNYSGSRLSPVMDHINATVDQIERPLLTPDEVARIKPPKKKGQGINQRIVEPGDMLIFVAGQYPIYGKQMLYFFDPEFMRRSQIPPPAKLGALAAGKLIAQSPAGATANDLSRAEESPAAADNGSPMERAFQQEYQRTDAEHDPHMERWLQEQMDNSGILHRWLSPGETVTGTLITTFSANKHRIALVEFLNSLSKPERVAAIVAQATMRLLPPMEVTLAAIAKPRQATLQKAIQREDKVQNAPRVPPPKRHPHIEALLTQSGEGTRAPGQVAPPTSDRNGLRL